jgi:hypothetical protein
MKELQESLMIKKRLDDYVLMAPRTITSPDCDKWLSDHIPYRIKLLHGLDAFVGSGGKEGPLEEVFPNIFEGALIGCRWLGHFLGLRPVDSTLSVQQRTRRRRDYTDVFSIDLGGLLVSSRDVSPEESNLLFMVLKGANIATAHPTIEGLHPLVWNHVRKATPLLIRLIKSHVYDKLNQPLAEWKRPES